MRLNGNIQIVGQKVILVPYETKHVERYNEWMQSEELQELTASEPLTLQQEYEMQQSWRQDEDKCTFLILDKAKFAETGDEIGALIGDTNLFLSPGNDDDEGRCGDSLTAEAEIMIAEPSVRGQHFGWEAMLLMLAYGQEHIGCTRFVAKIGCTNERSIAMFAKMRFEEVSRSEVFQEVTLERKCSDDWVLWLRNNTDFATKEYT